MTETPLPEHSSRRALFAHLTVLGGATAAVFLAGWAQEGNLGVFLTVAGLAMAVFPPRGFVDRKIAAFAAVLFLLGTSAFLPAAWLGSPTWRENLLAAGVPLGPWVTPVPRETAWWLAIFGCTLGSGLLLLSHPLRSKSQLLLATIAAALCGTYTGLALGAANFGWQLPFDPDPAEFGFFLNRNHTAALLVTGSIVSLGLLTVAFRRRHGVAGTIAAICLTLCVGALIFQSSSRGGIVFLVVGGAIWVLGLGKSHRSKPLLISFAALFAGAILLFLAPRSAVRERLFALAETTANPEVPLDFRLLIFRDTLNLIRDFPLTGTGVGSFRYVIPFYRQHSLAEVPLSHPESDWLMAGAELGLIALLVMGALLFFSMRQIAPLRAHPYWPLRWGLLSAALAALLHGLVDVPAHRVALGWWMLVLAGLALQTFPGGKRTTWRYTRLFFPAGGIVAMLLGSWLIRAQWYAGPPSPPYAAFRAEGAIISQRMGGDLDLALNTARQSIAESPMASRLHFQLGTTLLQKGAEAEAERAFAAQRLLSPEAPQVLVDQGYLWLSRRPEKTAALWMEAVARAERIDRATAANPVSGALNRFRDLLQRSAPFPELQREMLLRAPNDPAYRLAGLEAVKEPVFTKELDRLASDRSFTGTLSIADRRRFFLLWYRAGDRDELATFLAEHPAWEAERASFQTMSLRDTGRFEELVTLLLQRHVLDLSLPAVGATAVSGDGAPAVVAEFSRHWAAGNTITARRLLQEAIAAPAPVPAEVWRLAAAVAMFDRDWPAAAQHLEKYLRASGLDALP